MSRHQAAILNFYGSRLQAVRPGGARAEITRLVQSHLKPKLIFSRALDVLVREKVEVPGYFPLAALILTAINQHNRRLTSTVEALLTPDTRALLDTLLRQESAGEEQCDLQTDLDEEAVAVDQTGDSERTGRRSAVG